MKHTKRKDHKGQNTWIDIAQAIWWALCGVALLVGFLFEIVPLEAVGVGGGGTALILIAIDKARGRL